jgi:hypothetical protein
MLLATTDMMQWLPVPLFRNFSTCTADTLLQDAFRRTP